MKRISTLIALAAVSAALGVSDAAPLPRPTEPVTAPARPSSMPATAPAVPIPP